MKYTCNFCNSTNIERVNTYKHYWFSCKDCGTAYSERKDHYPLSSAVCSKIIKGVNKLAFNKLKFLERIYLPIDSVREDESKYYSQYKELLKNNDTSLKSTEIQQFKDISKYLANVGIDFSGKKVLMISGGPGICPKAISEVAKELVVTEYSLETVKAMKKYLGLDAIQFDLNSDKLDDTFKGRKFDIVIASAVLGFCLDLRKFSDSLEKILSDDGVVFISHGAPTLGQMLFYQWDEYTALVMYKRETYLKVFNEHSGFKKIGEFDHNYEIFFFRLRQAGWKGLILYLFTAPFWILYGLIALFFNRGINKDFGAEAYRYVFKHKKKIK